MLFSIETTRFAQRALWVNLLPLRTSGEIRRATQSLTALVVIFTRGHMIKFFVIVFLFQANNPMFRFVSQSEVKTMEDCMIKVVEINTDESVPYSAACYVQKFDKDT
jgi:hypothetical protein